MTRRRKHPVLTHEKLLEVLHYERTTGILTWKISKRGPKRSEKSPDKYLKYKINGINYNAHVLAWFYEHGKWPQNDVVDHIDRNRQNNRIENLRDTTYSVNAKNSGRKLPKDGVVERADGRFSVITTFNTREEAEAFMSGQK